MPEVLAAYIIDLIVGDPARITHPVVIIGKAVEKCEKALRRWAAPLIGLKAAGVLLVLLIVPGTYLLTWGILTLASRIHPWAGTLAGVWLISTTLSVKGLAQAGLGILKLLDSGNIQEARRQVGWIVGRDTHNLDEPEITRAAVETVAENTVDGIIAPMFFAFIGGAPLAMAYKAVNTLDSMVGYKNDRYRDFGWAAARFDDACNYIPARLTGAFMVITLFFLGRPAGQAVRIIRRDAGKHPSPNSGIPEAAMAGGLGIRLGGLNHYGGVPSFRAFMGDPQQPLVRQHIGRAVRVMHGTALTGLVAGSLVTWFFG